MVRQTQSVLFVCMGNICRSPTAEAVFRHCTQQAGLDIQVDSAGTIGFHRGSKPDTRAIRAGKKRGYDFSSIRARKVEAEDFERFDLILAMDNDNYQNLQALAPSREAKDKVQLFLRYAQNSDYSDVPDPYYGGAKGFELVLDLIEEASQGLLDHICA